MTDIVAEMVNRADLTTSKPVFAVPRPLAPRLVTTTIGVVNVFRTPQILNLIVQMSRVPGVPDVYLYRIDSITQLLSKEYPICYNYIVMVDDQPTMRQVYKDYTTIQFIFQPPQMVVQQLCGLCMRSDCIHCLPLKIENNKVTKR